MTRSARTYAYSVIGAGAMVVACAIGNHSLAVHGSWAIYIALALLASVVQLRLPGEDGSYSLSFLFLLYGVAYLSLAETLVAGCAGVVVQGLTGRKSRPRAIQVLFNSANVAITVGACFLIGRVWLAPVMARHLPAVMAAVAFVYFAINTVLVSGILSLLQQKPIREVCGQWYVWSFPCYLVGVTLVGLAPSPGRAVSLDAWLLLLPTLFLVHFFWGLAGRLVLGTSSISEPNPTLPRAARVYLIGVIAFGLLVLATALAGWHWQDSTRFLVYLACGVAAATFKIRLPGIRGTITPAFVILLVAIAQLSFAETVVAAAVVGVVQVVWRAARRPVLAQVLFNPACLALSAALAWLVSRFISGSAPGNSVAGFMLVSTLILYGSNTLLVAAMLALIDRKPLRRIWYACCSWSLPYYLIGAAAAGVMTSTSQAADWPASLLVLPLVGLVNVSYRLRLGQVFALSLQATA